MNKLRQFCLYLWLSGLLLTTPVATRGERLPIKLYTSADGLGSSFVDDLMRDSRGFMWFCTRDGLSRFDGSRFVTYRISDKNSPPGFEGLYQTRDGTYWISTSAGLYRFKPEAASQAAEATGDRPVLNAEFVSNGGRSLFEDRNGTLWSGNDDLYQVKEINGKFVFEPARLNIPVSPNYPLAIYQIREAPDGCLWLNTNQGVVRRFPDGRRVLYQHESRLQTGLTSMVIEPGGRVWVVWRNDFYVINPAPTSSVQVNQELLVKPIAPNSVVSTKPDVEINLPNGPDEVLRLEETSTNAVTGRLYLSRDEHIWLVSDANLFEFDGRKFLAHGAAQGLPAGMGEMEEDSAGNLWIGGRTALVRLDRKGLVTYGKADGLDSPNIEGIIEGRDGSIYVANGGFSLSRYDGQGFQTSRPPLAPDARALWTSHAAFLSTANEWWFLSTSRLYRFNATTQGGPLATYDSHHGFKSDEMYQMFEDSRGDLWISQQPSQSENRALYRLKKGETDFYRFSAAEGFPDGKSAMSFAEDRAGNLWFGFYEGGLVRFADGLFTQFTTKDGLPSGLISDLLLDRQGRLWMTSNSGVKRIDDPAAAQPVFVSLSTEQGLASNNARTITEDQLGNIYVGTVRGVDQISPDTTRIKHYSVSDGLAGDFVVDSHCDRSGTLWFATTNGLSRLLPSALERVEPPTIWLGGLRIAGEKQAVSELGQAELSKGDLKYTQNNFQIDFFGLDFHAGETLRYQFMLEGADSKWSAPTDQRTVTYANLRPGSYRFLVRAVNSDGTQSQRPAVLSFTILPPIWLRWWFLTLMTLVVFALLYALYRYRLAHLQQVNLALSEAKTAEEKLGRAREDRLIELQKVRTRIATDLHDDIGSSLTQIAILSEVAQQSIKGNGASLAPLKSIANVSNELVESMSDIVWAINPQKDHLQDLIQRMRRFASDLLLAKGISLDFEAPNYAADMPLGANPRREVFLIFKESLANVVKHSQATHVRIDFDVTGDDLSLKISDNGQGFDVSRLSAALFSDQKGGHGILSMKKRAAEMNGRFEIKSEPGRGTEIVFQLPLTQVAA